MQRRRSSTPYHLTNRLIILSKKILAKATDHLRHKAHAQVLRICQRLLVFVLKNLGNITDTCFDADMRKKTSQTKTPPVQHHDFSQRFAEGAGIFLLFISVYVLLSLLSHHPSDPSFNVATPSDKVENIGGMIGAYTSDFLIQFFGLSSFILPLIFAISGFQMLRHNETQTGYMRTILLPLILITFSVLSHMANILAHWPQADAIGNGGLVGALTYHLLQPLLGSFGCAALNIILLSLCTMWWTGLTFHDVIHGIRFAWKMFLHWRVVIWRRMGRINFKRSKQITLPLTPPKPKVAPLPKMAAKIVKPEPTAAPAPKPAQQQALPLDLGDGESSFQFPPLEALNENSTDQSGETEEALQNNARQIETQLANFGVRGQVTKICPGPVITIYELEPAAGVKTSAVVGLSDDLARAMSATAIRIAPIPGRTVIGIEVPNRKRLMVAFKDMLADEQFETHPGKLVVSMGVDTSGKAVYADISKMPHALIAGTTGSGKSVAMNAFIVSLLYRMSPDQLKFVMIDPKMLELSIYNGIPHLISPVIIDPHKASAALKWVVSEMENRYRMMTDLGVKNIQSFNTKFADMKARDAIPMKNVQTGFDPETGQPTFEQQPVATESMPYIVVVIDELADLMMVAGKEVEVSIARLAQMARASGIHLLIATQRPSVDVITGLIKANVPTRISFSVTSKIDSRTVLDSGGAEQLLGRGDMLYMENGSNNLIRLHGSFIDEDECHAVVNHLKSQKAPDYTDIFTNAGPGAAGGSSGPTGGDSDNDPLYQQAIEIVAREQKASTSFIQRHLKIGYNRAATLIERMEGDGLISAANHVGKREVIIKQPPESD